MAHWSMKALKGISKDLVGFALSWEGFLDSNLELGWLSKPCNGFQNAAMAFIINDNDKHLQDLVVMTLLKSQVCSTRLKLRQTQNHPAN